MIYSTLELETQLFQQGYELICGIDEVGRGCFAGPVVAGAVVLNISSILPIGIADSKLLKPKTREELALEIKKRVLAWAVGEGSVEEINTLGIVKATQLAYKRAIEALSTIPHYYLIDAFYIDSVKKSLQKPVIKGDMLCSSIAAASIIAKVYRDKLMTNLDKLYPGYGFKTHKGYGTLTHRQAIKQNGLTNLHRKSFNLEKFL